MLLAWVGQCSSSDHALTHIFFEGGGGGARPPGISPVPPLLLVFHGTVAILPANQQRRGDFYLTRKSLIDKQM